MSLKTLIKVGLLFFPLCLFGIGSSSYKQVGSSLQHGAIIVSEIDGDPVVSSVQHIKVTSGDLTDNGDGTVTILTAGSATVNIETGTGLTGGPITGTGTISLDTTYTDANYLKLDQTTPQTITNGAPLFSAGVTINADNQKILVGANADGSIYFDGQDIRVNAREIGGTGNILPTTDSYTGLGATAGDRFGTIWSLTERTNTQIVASGSAQYPALSF